LEEESPDLFKVHQAFLDGIVYPTNIVGIEIMPVDVMGVHPWSTYFFNEDVVNDG